MSFLGNWPVFHYGDVIMDAIASQITSLTIVYSIVYSDAHQRKHQSSASLAFVQGIHRGPVNSPHKWPVTRKMFPLDDVIMWCESASHWWIAIMRGQLYGALVSLCCLTQRSCWTNSRAAGDMRSRDAHVKDNITQRGAEIFESDRHEITPIYISDWIFFYPLFLRRIYFG